MLCLLTIFQHFAVHWSAVMCQSLLQEIGFWFPSQNFESSISGSSWCLHTVCMLTLLLKTAMNILFIELIPTPQLHRKAFFFRSYNFFLPSQETSHTLYETEVNCCVKNTSLASAMSEINAGSTLQTSSLISTSLLPSWPEPVSQRSVFFRFSYLNPLSTSLFSHACYKPRQSHFCRLNITSRAHETFQHVVTTRHLLLLPPEV
jgi:hypothetical protein